MFNELLPFNKGQQVVVHNLHTNIFRGIVFLNITDATAVEEIVTNELKKC